jgi:hypothetical protein
VNIRVQIAHILQINYMILFNYPSSPSSKPDTVYVIDFATLIETVRNKQAFGTRFFGAMRHLSPTGFTRKKAASSDFPPENGGP